MQHFNYYHIVPVRWKSRQPRRWFELEIDVSAHLYVLLTKPLKVSYQLINVPSNICECCIMNVSNKAKWSCLLSVIQQDWIQSCHCKHHAVWQSAIMFYFMSVLYISNYSNNVVYRRYPSMFFYFSYTVGFKKWNENGICWSNDRLLP